MTRRPAPSVSSSRGDALTAAWASGSSCSSTISSPRAMRRVQPPAAAARGAARRAARGAVRGAVSVAVIQQSARVVSAHRAVSWYAGWRAAYRAAARGEQPAAESVDLRRVPAVGVWEAPGGHGARHVADAHGRCADDLPRRW